MGVHARRPDGKGDPPAALSAETAPDRPGRLS